MFHWLTSLFARRRLEREFRDEIADHLARDISWRQRQGATLDAATRAAHADLGRFVAATEGMRDAHGLTTIDDIRRDARQALRRLRRTPGFSGFVTFTLALGIGAATSVFSAVDGVLLKPLPFRDPGALVTLWQTKPSSGLDRDDVAPRTFLDWAEQTRSYSTIAAGNPYSVNYRTRERNETVEAWQVTGGFFRLLDAKPHLGRTLRPDDFSPGSAPVVVLDHDFWVARLGGDPSVLGSSLTFEDRPHVIVGVMPPGLELPERTAVWLPWVPDSAQAADRFGTYARVFGRLAPGTSVEAAQAELVAIAARLAVEYPRSNTGVGARVIPLRDIMVRGRASLLWTLLGASTMLLLLTVTNVAALQMTRLAHQRQETAVRAALGARGARLVRPQVVEALLLALAGGAAGLGAAWVGIRLIHRYGPADLPRINAIALDARAAVMVLALALGAGVLLAALSTRSLGKTSLATFLGTRGAANQRGAVRGRRLAVGVQLAIAFALLAGSSLLVRSFRAVLASDRGYDTTSALSFTTWVYSEHPTPADRQRFAETVIERLHALPGVRRATMGSSLPLADAITGELADVVMDGAAVAEGEEPQARGSVVWPNYFETLGIGLRRGRAFTPLDDASSELVVVVNEAFARRFSPEREVVDRMVRVGLMGRSRPRRVIGVVADTRHARLDAPAEPAIFIPWQQQPLAALTFVARANVDAASLMPAVQRLLFEIDPRVGVARLATMEQLVDASVRDRRFLLLLLGLFASVAIALACVGVAAVTSQVVAERTREIGVRLALGATASRIRRELLVEALGMGVVGLSAGLALALGSGPVIKAFLYGISSWDLPGLATAGAVLLLATLVAAYVPSWRATRVDPAAILKDG